MSVTPISQPLPGEQVVDLSPSDAQEAAVTWQRRPNLFPGRALTAPTLEARGEWAAGHVVLRGQSLTPGVVQGLEVGCKVTPPAEPGARAQVRLMIGAGRAIAVTGEDVWLPRAIELDFHALPVVASPEVFETGDGTDEGADDGDGSGTDSGDEAEAPGVMRARAIGPSLAELLADDPAALPPAGVLVLQPVALDTADTDPLDPCDRCGCAEGNVSYEDWRIADAVRLIWYAWPEEWRALPAAGPRFRNSLAWTIFDAERELDADVHLPWEDFGVPVALIGVDGDFVPVFCDRGAVVRAGGRPRASRLQLTTRPDGSLGLAPRPRLAPLWQARIEQLAGQIADLGDPAPAPDVLARSFGRLPPFGLLPTNAFDLASRSSRFFPGGFDLDAVPVPIEQLDVAVRDSAALAPLDFSLGERVRVLVPVTQASWEPRLLLTEVIDPLFQQALDSYLIDRSRALGARQGVRTVLAVLRQAIDATPPAVPPIETDPDALEVESLAPWGPPPAGGGHRAALMDGLHQHFFDSASGTLTVAAGDALYAWVYLDPDFPPRTLMLQWNSGGSWEHRAYWGANLVDWGTDGTASRLRMGELPPVGQWVRLPVPAASVDIADRSIGGMAFTLFDGRAAYGHSGRLQPDGTELVWFASTLPAGAVQHGDYAWDFLTANGLWAPFEPSFGLVDLPANSATGSPAGMSGVIRGLLTGGALDSLSNHEKSQLAARGLKGFVEYLTSRANRADDVIDLGFLKIQTDVYRVRQLVLNTTAATRLAVSPTLASIAQAETAVASQEQISTFFEALKSSAAVTRTRDTPLRARTIGVTAGVSTGASALPTFGVAARPSVSDAAFAAAARPSASEPALGAAALRPSVTEGVGARISGARIAPDAPLERFDVADRTARRFDTGIRPIVKGSGYSPRDIANQSPLIGNATLRALTIAERLAQPKAQEARDYSSASRRETVNRLLTLADALRAEDAFQADSPGETSGLFAGLEVFGVKDDPFLDDADDTRTARRRPFADFLDVARRGALLSRMLQMPPLDTDPDESAHFSNATDTSDTTVALLRQVEGRVRQFRDVINACSEALVTAQFQYDAARASEAAWSERLGEARHDVAVTRALIAEETARLDAVNARRAQVLATEVRFLGYVRPRDAENLLTPPTRNLDPGLIEAPVPACLRAHADVPDELTEMLAVVREAPAAWFGQGSTWFEGLNRVGVLVKAVQTTQLRTQLAAAAVAPVVQARATGLAGAMTALTAKHAQAVRLARGAALQIDTARLASLTWQGAFQQAKEVVSLGDLIAGEHGSGPVARRAADFYDDFAGICTCLHAEFCGVPPAIRLGWATQLSEFDVAPSLRNLASLPRWSGLDFVDRRQMQAYVDWLFSQSSAGEPRAQELVNDVVRMCLLLASHSPVDQIIAGRIPRPVTVRPGVRFPLVALDARKLRLGMEAVVYRANQIVARAVVEDVGGAEISARVVHTISASVELDETARVQFASPASIRFDAPAPRSGK